MLNHRELASPSASNFTKLPTELRLQIWHLALPPGRVLRIAFKMPNDSHEHAHIIGPVTIPSILHICHESREVTKNELRLGFGKETSKFDRDWWHPSADILYLPHWQPPLNWDLRVSFNFQEGLPYQQLDISRDDSGIGLESRHTYLATVQHLALPFSFKVLNGIRFSDKSGSWLPRWLHGFRCLKSVTLLIDYFPQWYKAGEIAILEPTNVPVNNPPGGGGTLSFNTPLMIERKISQKLEEYRHEFEPSWELPRVEIRIVENRAKD
jgi:hypothetical protein